MDQGRRPDSRVPLETAEAVMMDGNVLYGDRAGSEAVPQTGQSYLGRQRRINVRFEAVLIEPDGCKIRVQVLDVSSSGFRIKTNAELVIDEEVMLQFARSRPMRAKICWARGPEAGGIFLDPAEELL